MTGSSSSVSTGATVLVTGAAGLIGQAVVRYLVIEGYEVRALVHRNGSLRAMNGLTVTEGSMTDARCLQRITQGVRFIVHLAARKADEADSEAVNTEGARNLLRAAEEAGVERIMNISTQSVKLPRHGRYAASKAAGDAILTRGSVPVTTLRLSVVYGGHNDGILGSLLQFARLPIIPVIGNGRVEFHPIHRDDVARAIERLMRNPDSAGRTYDAGGSEVWTFDELLKACARRIGKTHPRLLHIPIPVAMWMARVMSVLPRPPITVSNVLGSAVVVPMDPTDFIDAIGFTPRMMQDGLDALTFPTQEEEECVALLRYVLPDHPVGFPDADTTTRMLEALQVHGLGAATLDRHVRRSMWLLGSLDAVTAIRHRTCILRRKLLVAAAIAECTPASAPSLLPRDRSIAHILWICARSGVSAGLKLTIGCALSLFFPAFLRRNAGC